MKLKAGEFKIRHVPSKKKLKRHLSEEGKSLSTHSEQNNLYENLEEKA